MHVPQSSASSQFSTANGYSWRAVFKLALLLFLPLALAASALFYVLLKTDTNARLQKLQVEKTGDVSVSAQLLAHDFDEAISDLQFLANAPSLKRYVNSHNPSEKQRITEHFRNMAQSKGLYDQVRFIDQRGMEKIRVNRVSNKAVVVAESSLQNKAGRYFFKDTLKLREGEIYISPMDLNIEHDKVELPYVPTLRLGTPVFNNLGEKQGILLLNYYGQGLLHDFIQTMGEERHAMLLNSEGYWLRSPDPAHEWGFMFGREDTFGKLYPDEWASISSQQQGSILTRRGLYTFTTVQPLRAMPQTRATEKTLSGTSLQDYHWKIVSFVPAAELPAVSGITYPRSFVLFGFGMLLFAVLSLYLAATLLSRRQLRHAVFENEERLNEITSSMAEGVYVVDAQGLTTFVNPEAERLLGISFDKIKGQPAHLQLHSYNPENHPNQAEDCEIYQVIRTGNKFHSNTQKFWHKDGTFMYVDVSITPILRNKMITGAVMAFSDISAQKQAEAALLSSQEKLQQAQHLAQLGSWELDFRTQELSWSDEIFRIFEIDPSAFAASYEAFLNAIHPDDREAVNLAYTESVKNHTAYNIEHRLLFSNGRIKHVIERGETFYGPDDQPTRSIGTVQDVTTHKMIEEEILRAEAMFHMVFNSVADAIVIHDVTGRFIEVNQVFCERMGYSREELLQLSPADINDETGARKFKERGADLKAQGKITFETVHISKEGRKIPVEISASLIDYAGQPATLSVVRDISERKIAQEALRASAATSSALLNATTETAILMDIDGTVRAINKVAAKRLHTQPHEIINRNIYELLPPEIATRRKAMADELISSGQPVHFIDERNGLCLEQTLYPIFNTEGKVSQIAIYAADITERKRLEAEETLLHHIDQQVLRSDTLSILLKFICNELAQLFDYQFAWIGKKERGGAFSIAAQSGAADGYIQALMQIGVRWDDTPQGRGPAGTCIRSGHMQVFKTADENFQPWREAATQYNFKSIAGIPLVVRGEVYGGLMLYSRRDNDFDETTTLQRLSGIASRICVALEMSMDQEQLRLLGSALASAGNSIFITDPAGRILWVNNSFTRLTGYSAEDSIGQTPALLKSEQQDASYYKELWKTIQQGKTWSHETVERHKSGMLITVQQTITPILNEEGKITHFISILDDISAQKETAARIQYMAHFDALTSLPNRALFHDRLHQILVQAKRDKLTSALMFIDLDRFKAVNDTLGHHIGDLLLQEVAQRLKACIRESDTVARLGGDEFTVLLPQVNTSRDASSIAEKIIASLAQPFQLDQHEVNIGCSIGIAFAPTDANTDDDLIKCADSAMYSAKEQGRGVFRFYVPTWR